MTLSKTDFDIASAYVQRLVPNELHDLFDVIRAEYERTLHEVLLVTGSARLLEGQDTLDDTLRTRDHYLRPLQLLQVQLLERVRHERQRGDVADDTLQRALALTINAIATGLRNTG
jgi:phosphoenolpyruvate carboxylase